MVIIEYLLMALSILSPFIIIPIVWKYFDAPKWARILAGVLLSLIFSSIFYISGIAVIFRDGMGPG